MVVKSLQRALVVACCLVPGLQDFHTDNTFETFFHDLIIIDNELEPEKVIDQMTIYYQDKSIRDLQSVDMEKKYPVDYKTILVCAILTEKLEHLTDLSKKFSSQKIPVISLVTSGQMESNKGSEKNVNEEALDPLQYLSKDLKFNQKPNLVKSTNLDHFVKILEHEVITQGILGRGKKDALAVYLIARFCDEYPEQDNELCTLIQKCSQIEVEKAFITAVRSQRFWFVDLVARQKKIFNAMLSLDFLEELFEWDRGTWFARQLTDRAERNLKKIDPAIERKNLKILQETLQTIFGKQMYEPHSNSLGSDQSLQVSQTDLYDYLFLYSLVNMMPESIDFYWRRSSVVLGGTLACAQMMESLQTSNSMSWNHKASAAQHADKFKSLALELLRECSLSTDSNADKMLSESIRIAPVNFCGNYKRSCLDIVTKIQFQEFVTEDACQQVLIHRWYDPISAVSERNTTFMVILCCIFPILSFLLEFNPENHGKTINHKGGGWTILKDMWLFCVHCPLLKFFYFGMSHLIFTLLFIYFVLFEYQPVFDWNKSYLEYIIWFWQLVLFLEEIYQLSKMTGASFMEKVNMYVDSYWNKIDIIGCVSMLAALALRLTGAYYNQYHDMAQVAKSCYALSVLMACSKVLYALSLNENLGPKVQMVRDMLIDTIVFLMLLIVVLLGCGVTFEFILLQDFSGRLPPHQTIKSIFDHTFWPMIGEFGPMTEFVASSIDPDDGLYQDQLGTFFGDLRIVLAFLLLVVFVFATNVILLNLLIAMYSFTFNKIQASSTIVFKYQRYELQIEHRNRGLLVPPPLSFLEMIIRKIFSIPRKISCKKQNRIDATGRVSSEKSDTERKESAELFKWQLGIKHDLVYRMEKEEEEAKKLKEEKKEKDKIYKEHLKEAKAQNKQK